MRPGWGSARGCDGCGAEVPRGGWAPPAPGDAAAELPVLFPSNSRGPF